MPSSEDKAVYFINHPFDYVKIGVSNNPRQRLDRLQQGTPYDLWIFAIIDTPHPYASETALHEKFSHRHVHGEWYRLTRDDREFVMEIADYTGHALDLYLTPDAERRESTLRWQALVG